MLRLIAFVAIGLICFFKRLQNLPQHLTGGIRARRWISNNITSSTNTAQCNSVFENSV